jgi:hypothetical protein
MATTLLPKARIGIKRTTINSSVLRELKPEKRGKSTNIERIGPKASFIDKLEGIRKFFLKKYESNLFSFVEGRKLREREKIKIREEKLEKKSKRSILPTIGAPAPAKSIFSSIGNFLLFMAGGVLFNRFVDLEKSFGAIAKTFEIIGKGVEFFADIVGNLTNFIDSAVKGYDDFLQKIEDVSGFDKKKIEKFMEDFKYVINGAVIAAILTVRALPLFVSRFLRNRLRKPSTPNTSAVTSNTLSRMRGGSNTGIDYRRGFTPSGQPLRSGPSISRFNNSMAKYISGKADPGDMLRLLRRGFFKPFAKFTLNSKALKILPFGIGSFIDFIVQYFVFKEPAGRAAFKSIAAGLFGFLGGLLGGPFALATSFGGAYLGDYVGGKLYDAIFGDSGTDVSGIDEYPEYDQITNTTNNFIQPIET